MAPVAGPDAGDLRSLLVLASRGFSEGSEFDVRYYFIGELLQLFSQRPIRASITRLIIDIAEALRGAS
jgi:hypothetical protein